MKSIVRRISASFAFAIVWLSVSTSQAAICNLIFEVIPSKDTAVIVGQELYSSLARKTFTNWQEFTNEESEEVLRFLDANFGSEAEFRLPILGIGGFEGNSSPNVILSVDFPEKLSNEELGESISEIAAAVGYTLIQDGTVAHCTQPVGEFGNASPLYFISPLSGFRGMSVDFVKTAYSAIVDANNDPSLGYTFDRESMVMLDFGGLPEQLAQTNDYFGSLYSVNIQIQFRKGNDQPSVYLANNWFEDPTGKSLLKFVSEELHVNLKKARRVYTDDLRNFANQN
jgi:hypothetical protein